MPPTRLLDLKLKCIFELTESDQQRVQQQVAQTQPVTAAAAESTTNKTSADSSLKSAKSAMSGVSTSSFAKDNFMPATSDFDSTTAHKTTAGTPAASAAISAAAGTGTPSAASVSSRLDKNDNTLNELKLLRQENDNLRKEVARLKVRILLYPFISFIYFTFTWLPIIQNSKIRTRNLSNILNGYLNLMIFKHIRK